MQLKRQSTGADESKQGKKDQHHEFLFPAARLKVGQARLQNDFNVVT